MGAGQVITPREAEVLAAVGSHLTNAQIANRLHLSVRTVETHVAALLRKLGVADRQALAELAPAIGTGPAPGAGILALPAPWTSLVGRHGEVADVVAALDGSRLVTLVGPGGVGKSRLAVAVAHAAGPSFPFGGVFVELVPVQPDFVIQAVATTLRVTDQPGRTLEQNVQGHLARRRMLIVLDNCEHVLPAAAAFVGNLLAACPQVTVLTTSRERLGVAGERVIAVNPLATDGATRMRHACSSSGRRRPIRSSPMTVTSWHGCVPAWTGCHWRSNWPPPVWRRSARRPCWTRPPTGCGCSPAGTACWRGTSHCEPSWTGATACSASPNGGCCAGSACSPTASTWPRWPVSRVTTTPRA